MAPEQHPFTCENCVFLSFVGTFGTECFWLFTGWNEKDEFQYVQQEHGGCECWVSPWDVPSWQRTPVTLLRRLSWQDQKLPVAF